MAGVKFDDFLLQYYLQTRFNDMPPEKRKTFMTYLENGDDFRGNMKMWKRRLMHDNQGQWEQNDLPDPVSANSPWQMSNDEWRKLYKEFREIMRSLDARASKFKDQNNPAYNKDAYEFVKEYFGPNKLFSHVTATPEAEAELDKLAQYLTTNPGIEKTLDDWGLVDGDFTFKALKEGLQKKEYNKNSIFDFMEFDNIYDNMIVQQNGKRFLMVIECQGIVWRIRQKVFAAAIVVSHLLLCAIKRLGNFAG